MKALTILYLLLPILFFDCGFTRLHAFETDASSKPNIVYFLIDDLGFADCGFNGGTDIRTPNIDKLAKEGAILKSFYVQPVCSPTRAALMTGRYATHLVAKEACRLIKNKPVDKPMFLYVPFNGIHGPHQVPKNYKEPYQNLPKLRQTIAGMLSAVDEAIGQITVALVDAGLRENTLLIFSSDNGGPAPGKATMNTPLRAGKGTVYEGGIRVCAFVNWPGRIKAGITVNEPMHVVDWYPTLVKLAGAPVEQKLQPDGLDIWPVLTQGAKSPHDAILLVGNKPGVSAIRMGDWKLLLNASDKDAEDQVGDQKGTGEIELYNLADDISESKNLADAQPEKVKGMRTRLDAMLRNAVLPGDVIRDQKLDIKKQKKGNK